MATKNDIEFESKKFISSIRVIEGKVAEISANIEQPDKFAEIFCKAAKTQKSIDLTLRDILVELIAKDAATKESISLLVQQIDRNNWKILTNKVFIWITTMVSTIVGALIYRYLG
ncbi:MAG: hypothetical protein WCG04_02400 [Alphaproteobacteria bacterium]